ncbi:MAG: hypothetical protein DRG24_03035 [Epsilonproteobacteria bacterium]|nr:MAG: hypothetical protein DRG24_03035 [Campylobacterota bacterium]
MNELIEDNSIEKIREIIFGTQSRKIKSEIEALHKFIDTLHATTQEQLQTLQENIQQEIQQVKEQFEDKIEQLSSLSEAEDNHLHTLIESEEKRSKESDEILQNEIARVNALIQKTIASEVETLESDKVSKLDMSEMLLDFAMRVKSEGKAKQSNSLGTDTLDE